MYHTVIRAMLILDRLNKCSVSYHAQIGFEFCFTGVRLVIGFTDYIDEVLQDDGDERAPRREGDDGGITFTAKSPRTYSA